MRRGLSAAAVVAAALLWPGGPAWAGSHVETYGATAAATQANGTIQTSTYFGVSIPAPG